MTERPEIILPPHSVPVERVILASILTNPVFVATAMTGISDDSWFYLPQHRMVFNAMRRLFNKGAPIDIPAVALLLEQKGQLEEVGGRQWLLQLDESTPWANEQIVELGRLALRRRLYVEAQGILRQSLDNTLPVDDLAGSACEKIFAAVSKDTEINKHDFKKDVRAVEEEVVKRHENRSLITGIPSGISDLDEDTGGLHDGEYTIIAGRPSMGKTTLALNILRHIAVEEKLPALMFSLETTEKVLIRNMVCASAKVNSTRLRTGYSPKDDLARWREHAAKIYEAPIHFYPKRDISILDLLTQTRVYKAVHGIRVVFIDHLGLIRPLDSRQSLNQQVSEVSRFLKTMAADLNLPVVSVCQLNRKVEDRKGNVPVMSDLRDSGTLEQDADNILLLYRNSYYNKSDISNTLEIEIAKQRNSVVGTTVLHYDIATGFIGNSLKGDKP